MDCQEFCARFGWSAEKFRKVAQRARARLRVLVADYEAGERCRSLADDLAAYVAHVAGGEQSERVRRHLTNCPACAQTARELERVARGVGALLPLPPTVDPEVVHRFGVVGRVLGRLLPFWDTGESAAAAKAGAAGAAAAAGGGAVTAGGSVVGVGGGQARCHGTVRGRRRGRLRRLRPDRALQRTAAARAPPHRDDRERGAQGAAQAPSALAGGHAYPRADHPHDPPAAPPPLPRAPTEGRPLRLRRLRIRPAASSASRARAARRAPRRHRPRRRVVGAGRQRRGAICADNPVGSAHRRRRHRATRRRRSSGSSRGGPWARRRCSDCERRATGSRRRCDHRRVATGGVAERPRGDPEAPPEGLDEVRGLAVAHQPRDVGHRQRLVGEELGGVAQPHRAQVGGEGGQADLVVGAFELARRDRQGMSERRRGSVAGGTRARRPPARGCRPRP